MQARARYLSISRRFTVGAPLAMEGAHVFARSRRRHQRHDHARGLSHVPGLPGRGGALRSDQEATALLSTLAATLEDEDDVLIMSPSGGAADYPQLYSLRTRFDAAAHRLNALTVDPTESALLSELILRAAAYRKASDVMLAASGSERVRVLHRDELSPLLRQATAGDPRRVGGLGRLALPARAHRLARRSIGAGTALRAHACRGRDDRRRLRTPSNSVDARRTVGAGGGFRSNGGGGRRFPALETGRGDGGERDAGGGSRSTPAAASHELRTPLTTLQMTFALLAEGAHRFGDAERETVATAQLGFGQLAATVDGFLDLATLDAGRIILRAARHRRRVADPSRRGSVRVSKARGQNRRRAVRCEGQLEAWANC